MKLQKLTIHNIASIEDAVIDFDAQPLATSEVFLITGKTGAGKSTILDAICLALYATTPRLENTNMQGKSVDVDNEVNIDDPRQLMRRNTGEAFVNLTFVGSNEVHYEATWSVIRARKKVGGNLQSRKWQLKNLDTDNTLTKKDEIENEIRIAVGLQFSQFCRTTMLAQGEFTRFLNSQDKEKAEILEKITGVSIYSKIGKKVFDVTQKKQKAWEDAARLLNDTKVLSDEEIAEHKGNLKIIEETLELLKEERDAIDKKRTWLNADAELTKKFNTATANYESACKKTNDDAFKAKELLIKQWDETIEARGWLKEINDAVKVQTSTTITLEKSRDEFVHLKKGELWFIENTKNTETELKALNADIEAEQNIASIYDNSQTIIGLLQGIDKGRSSIATESESLKKEEERLNGKLAKAKSDAEVSYAKAKADFESQEDKLKSQEKELAASNLPILRQDKEKYQGIITLSETAMDKIAAFHKEQERHEKKKQELTDMQKGIEELEQQLKSLIPQIHDAEIKANTCKELLDKQRESVDDWAKAMRAKLKVGDVCPVCQQKIESEIPHEDELDSLFLSLETAWKEADKALNLLKDKEKQLNADIKSQTKALKKATEDFKKDTNLSDAESAAKEACYKCGLDFVADDSTSFPRHLPSVGKFGLNSVDKDSLCKLQTLHNESKSLLTAVIEKIKIAEGIEKTVTDCHKETERLRKLKEKAYKAVDDAERVMAECKAKIDTSTRLIQTKTDEISVAEKQVTEFLADSVWQNDWHSQPLLMAEELKSAAKSYSDKKAKQINLTQSLKGWQMQSRQIADAMNIVLEVKQDLNEIVVEEAEEIKNLHTLINTFATMIRTTIQQKEEASNKLKANEERLHEFCSQHDDYTNELLSAISRHSGEEIIGIRKETTRLLQEISSSKTLLESVDAEIKKHIENKPNLSDEDSLESLGALMKEIEEKTNGFTETKATINLLLKQDEDNKKKQKELLADSEAKREVYLQWSRMNQLIGDSTGSKFRKIAQSYVLTSLIHSANSYMKTLTDRYTLKVTPGTFVIMLEDAYQGYVSRAASTISGGEGFLVSLALALALSDIGQTLSVDTLFIDEGFGTLSGEPLQNAINTLRTLHTKAGRHVGIISHVEELQERIPVQIQVQQEGNNSSSIINIKG